MSLIKQLTKFPVYKPMMYPFAYEFYTEHESMHWLPHEATLSDDITDYNRASQEEKDFITNILRLFTQNDIMVGVGYDTMLRVFKPVEVTMMLRSFANRENCYDDKTEILTNKGFILFQELTELDKVAQYHMNNGSIDYVHPDNITVSKYQGIMHHYETTYHDLMVTEYHNLVLKNPRTDKIFKDNSISKNWNGNYLSLHGGEVAGKKTITDMERLLIAIAADGTLRGLNPSRFIPGKKIGRSVQIFLKKSRKINRLIVLLDATQLSYNMYEKSNGFTGFSFSLPDSIDILGIKPLEFIKKINITDILDELQHWDSHIASDENFHFYSTEKIAIDNLQVACAEGNIRNTVKFIPSRDTLSPITGYMMDCKDSYRMSINLNTNETYYRARKDIEYNGTVYCAKVPSGCLIVRRNNKVVVSGNTHIDAYALLTESLGFGDDIYTEFINIPEMEMKTEYLDKAKVRKYEDYKQLGMSDVEVDKEFRRAVARMLAVYAGATEGISLFAQFAMLLKFQFDNKYKGMCQIVDWSIKDEAMHQAGNSELFRNFISENQDIWDDDLKYDIYQAVREIVEYEKALVDYLNPPHLDNHDVKTYIEYMADNALSMLGMTTNYGIKTNPLPFMDEVTSGLSLVNFFENRVTDYAKASLTGSWADLKNKGK